MNFFKTLKIGFLYMGVEYTHVINKDNVKCDGCCDCWEFWFNDGDYAFQVLGDLFSEDMPTSDNLCISIYKRGSKDRLMCIEGNDISIIKGKVWDGVSVGDTIYVTDRWNFSKLKVKEVRCIANRVKEFEFVQDCAFIYCHLLLNVQPTIQIKDTHLDEVCFGIDNETLLFADKCECRDYISAWQRRADNALSILDNSGYAICFIDNETNETNKSKVYNTKEDCYNAMVEMANKKMTELIGSMDFNNNNNKHTFNLSYWRDYISIEMDNKYKRFIWFIEEVE